MRYSPAKLPSADVVKTNAMVINDFYGCDFSQRRNQYRPKKKPQLREHDPFLPRPREKAPWLCKTAVYDGRINGRFSLDGTDIIHAGTKLYAGDTLISSAMNDAFSVGKNFDKALYLLDGAHYYKVTHSADTFTVAMYRPAPMCAHRYQ